MPGALWALVCPELGVCVNGKHISDMFFPDEIARTDAAHPTANSPISDDSGQASHGPDETGAGGGVEYGDTTL
eukprot:COSAG02_NODE_25838_length_647_cov_1.490876_1_plen_72_part_10